MRLRVGILTVSDRAYKGIYEDKSGPALREEVGKLGWHAEQETVVADDMNAIEEILINWCDQKKLDVVLTTGGTGLGPRDVTPEVTAKILEKELPGLAEAMRLEGSKNTALAFLSRAVAGSRGRTLVVNLPGSPKGAVESFLAVAHLMGHAVAMLSGQDHAIEEKVHD